MILAAEITVDRKSPSVRHIPIGDALFRGLTLLFALVVLLILSGVIFALVAGAWPALRHFGFGFLVTEPGTRSPRNSAPWRRSTARW